METKTESHPVCQIAHVAGFTLLGLLLVDAARTGRLLGIAQPGRWSLILGVAYGVEIAAVQLLLGRSGRGVSRAMFPAVAFLAGVGLVVVYRLRPDLAPLHVAWVSSGLAVMTVLALFGDGWVKLQQYRYATGAAGALLLLVTAIWGTELGGSRSWLRVGPMMFESFEFARILLILFSAAYLDEKTGWRELGPALAIWLAAVAALFASRDLGAVFLLLGTVVVMVYVASGRASYVALGAGGLAAVALACCAWFPHVRARFQVWLNPWAYAGDRGYQFVRGMFVMAAGGVFGTGLGLGLPGLVPEVHTDFAFAAIVEELGLAGGAAVLLGYLLFAHAALRTALRAPSGFGEILAAGLASAILLQALTIVGGVLGLVPLTGVPLPFISYGGSSMVSSLAIVGLLLAISRGEGEAG